MGSQAIQRALACKWFPLSCVHLLYLPSFHPLPSFYFGQTAMADDKAIKASKKEGKWGQIYVGTQWEYLCAVGPRLGAACM